MDKKLSNIYYSPQGYWKGDAAISKLAQVANIDEINTKKWLEKQSIWQIYKSPPNYIPHPHYNITIPNKIHQADLLFLPHDIVNRKTYKYALVVIDIASRYKDAEPLLSKESKNVSLAFQKIYKRSSLTWPETLMVDPGKEFMGDLSQLMKKHNVKIQRGESGNHRAQAFVERANRTIGEKIFSHQYAMEMIREGRSREWVKLLPKIIKNMNSEVTRLTGKEPKLAIETTNIDTNKVEYKRIVGLKEERLPGFVKVRYLYAPGEEEGGEKRRATDAIWSLEIYDLEKSIISPDQPILYYLGKTKNGKNPKRGFVREELQVVPEDSESPPNSIL